MNKLSKWAAGFLLLGATQIQAAQTNLIQNINILITAYAQGPSTTNGTLVTTTVNKSKLVTANVIQVLGASTGNAFSSTAKLLLVSPLPDGGTSIVVKDGTNVVDVTGFFQNDVRSDTMESSVLDTATGKVSGLSRDIERFMLQDQGGFPNLTLHFNARGLTVTKTKSVLNGQGQVIGQAHQVTAVLAGDGDQNGTNLVMQVLINTVGGAVQVQ